MDFREDYRKVGTLQSIFDCPVLALTATITSDIMADIKQILSLKDVNVVANLPDRPNSFLAVTNCTEKFENELEWLHDEISEKGRQMEKVIVYTNRIESCDSIYIWLYSTLKNKAYDGEKDIKNRLVEMYHGHTDNESKERILTDFKKINGCIKVLIATVAVGMGIDIPNISVVIMWGLPRTLLQLWQQAGRGGRDGRNSASVVYAFPRSISLPCDYCRKQGKRQCTCTNRTYLKELASTTVCQRLYCLKNFSLSKSTDSELERLKVKEKCLNTCTDNCKCKRCVCCLNCMMQCECSKHNSTLTAQLNTYLNP